MNESKKYPFIITLDNGNKVFQLSEYATLYDLDFAIDSHKQTVENYEKQKPLPKFIETYRKRLKYFEWLKGYG